MKENRVREVRKALGLTQEELAARAGISMSHLSRFERGKAQVSLAKLKAIAIGLGLTEMQRGQLLLPPDPSAPFEVLPPAPDPAFNPQMLRQVVRKIAEFLDTQGYSIPPRALAEAVTEGYLVSVRAGQVDESTLFAGMAAAAGGDRHDRPDRSTTESLRISDVNTAKAGLPSANVTGKIIRS